MLTLLELFDRLANLLELSISVWMVCSFLGFAIGLEAVTQLPQQAWVDVTKDMGYGEA